MFPSPNDATVSALLRCSHSGPGGGVGESSTLSSEWSWLYRSSSRTSASLRSLFAAASASSAGLFGDSCFPQTCTTVGPLSLPPVSGSGPDATGAQTSTQSQMQSQSQLELSAADRALVLMLLLALSLQFGELHRLLRLLHWLHMRLGPEPPAPLASDVDAKPADEPQAAAANVKTDTQSSPPQSQTQSQSQAAAQASPVQQPQQPQPQVQQQPALATKGPGPGDEELMSAPLRPELEQLRFWFDQFSKSVPSTKVSLPLHLLVFERS